MNENAAYTTPDGLEVARRLRAALGDRVIKADDKLVIRADELWALIKAAGGFR